MAIKRIVANIDASGTDARIEDARTFYGEILGLKVVMDHGWIMTLASDGSATPQISIATEGGSGTAVPDISIEVDNLDEVLERLGENGIAIEYGPTIEPWGVRRFYVRDPFGRLLNIMSHI